MCSEFNFCWCRVVLDKIKLITLFLGNFFWNKCEGIVIFFSICLSFFCVWFDTLLTFGFLYIIEICDIFQFEWVVFQTTSTPFFPQVSKSYFPSLKVYFFLSFVFIGLPIKLVLLSFKRNISTINIDDLLRKNVNQICILSLCVYCLRLLPFY